jgi:hypothetical protein
VHGNNTPQQPHEALEEGRRRAQVVLNVRDVEELLQLRESGLRMVGLHTTHDPMRIVVLVEGKGLEPVPPDVESPIIGGSVQSQRVQLDGTFTRWVRA